MAIFITGATGYLGSYATEWLLRNSDHELALLVRAADYDEGAERLWRAMQLHMDADEFHRHLDRICFICGELSEPGLGVSRADYDWLISNAESVLHAAASPDLRSESACVEHNLRGTLSVIKLGRAIQEDHPLRRFSLVSTVGVAGERPGAVVMEDEPLDWSRPDFNAYTRTKRFCEHMVTELLSDVPCLHLRPSSVIGDSRFPETTQFDLIRAICALCEWPVVPFNPDVRLDIVNADWAGHGIGELHLREDLAHDTFHLSAGTESRTLGEIAAAVSAGVGKRSPRFASLLARPLEHVSGLLERAPTEGVVRRIGALLSTFIPYVTTDLVYDNTRAVNALGTPPTPFTSYGAEPCAYGKSVNFAFPYRPLPEVLDLSSVPPMPVRPLA